MSLDSFRKALDFSEDEVCVGGPHKRFRCAIAFAKIVQHGALQLGDCSVTSAPDAALGNFSKEPLDQIQPASAGGSEVHMVAGMAASMRARNFRNS